MNSLIIALLDLEAQQIVYIIMYSRADVKEAWRAVDRTTTEIMNVRWRFFHF